MTRQEISGLSAEWRLLLCCGRTSPKEEEARKIQEIVKYGVNWPRLEALAREQGMFPLLHHNLQKTAWHEVPQQARRAITHHITNNAMHSLRMLHKMQGLLGAFIEDGIRAIPFKGPALALQIYGDESLRQYCDLDFLISCHEMYAAHCTMKHRGYNAQYDIPRTFTKHPTKIPAHLAYEKAGVVVELHSTMDYGYRIHYEKLWHESPAASQGPGELPLLTPEDLVLLLCVHGTKHFWNKLSQLSDIVALVESGQVKYQRLRNKMRETGTERVVGTALYLAQKLLGLHMEIEMERTLCHRYRIRTSVKKLYKNLRNQSFGPITGQLLQLQLRTPMKRGEYIRNMLFAPQIDDYCTFNLPPAFFPAYCLLRPLRLAKKIVYT